MPTYEYECGVCGPFEQFQRITEDPLSDCPRCGSAVRRLISSGTGIIFKGSGFYSTDSRNAGKGSSDDGGKDGSGAKDGSAGKDGSGGGKDGAKTGAAKAGGDGKSGGGAAKKEPAAATGASKGAPARD